MMRRDLLTAAPTFAFSTLLATGAQPASGMALAGAGGTDILRLFHRRQKIIATARNYVCNGSDEDEERELESLFYRRADRLEDQMMALPCTCAADFAAKVIVGTCKGEVFSDWETGSLWIEARRLTASGI